MSSDHAEETTKFSPAVAWIGLFAGPLAAAACCVFLPNQYLDAAGTLVEFDPAGRATLAAMAWMGIWWLTEAVPIYATGMLPVALFPVLGIATMKAASAPYANPLIFLFMGGFLLALSMEKWGLGKRIALTVLQVVGTRPVNIIAGFMVTTAVLSAFVSNTATTAMMLPIAASIILLVKTQGALTNNFSICLMLGIAYSASIGGMATIIGSPPNVFLVSYLTDSIAEPYRFELSFARWLQFGVPLAVVFLPIVFLLLTRVLYPVKNQTIDGSDRLIRGELDSLGPANRGEWATFLVFVATATLWMSRPALAGVSLDLDGRTWLPLAELTDSGIAMMAALVLFVIPVDVKRRVFVLDWETALKLPWGILILFGGGLSLAAAVQANGVAEFMGSHTHFVRGLPPVLVVLCVSAGMIFLTELTSNTATSATVIPILGAVAPGLDIHPYLLVFPAAIAASCAFMLPVATPPNAIVFATGELSVGQMARAGIWLNLISIVLVTVLTMLLIGPLLVR
ncbi:SLC13 family permease [Roseiconus lacunae]|uniref:SLC13 family permease n=1 Tax=Roseiconus lacunae TaxID=2605694 RepID=UPI00308FA71C|nr:SLC13 family permease [Stieleria sp. HD01]